MKKRVQLKSFDDILKALARIENDPFNLRGEWDAYQHMTHCGQALHFSTHGYPAQKPHLFQQTLGKATFYAFKAYGQLVHNTNEFTPGSEALPKNGLQSGLDFYRNQIIQFLDWQGPLKPHQFFGSLSKKNYIQFHTMHFANHFEQFDFLTEQPSGSKVI